MKLSEAIRAGKKWEDMRTKYVWVPVDGRPCKACAVGGALMAALGRELPTTEDSFSTVEKCEAIWPELRDIDIVCPLHGTVDSDGRESNCEEGGYEELSDGASGNPIQIASHLYSDHGWSKDAVADWVEKQVGA